MAYKFYAGEAVIHASKQEGKVVTDSTEVKFEGYLSPIHVFTDDLILKMEITDQTIMAQNREMLLRKKLIVVPSSIIYRFRIVSTVSKETVADFLSATQTIEFIKAYPSAAKG